MTAAAAAVWFTWGGSFGRWRSCMAPSCAGTKARGPLWPSSPRRKCLGWRNAKWWSRSYPKSSWCCRRRFLFIKNKGGAKVYKYLRQLVMPMVPPVMINYLQLRWKRAWLLCWRWNRGPCWRWRSCGSAFYPDRVWATFRQRWLPAKASTWDRCGNHLRCFRFQCRLYAGENCTKL